MSTKPIFHLAFPVKDVESTLAYYRDILGFEIQLIEKGRCILNFYGSQLVAHVSEKDVPDGKPDMYPRHFGVIFDKENDFNDLYERAKKAEVPFYQECFTRFKGTDRAHKSFFLLDPSKNLLEFKWYENAGLIFSEEVNKEGK